MSDTKLNNADSLNLISTVREMIRINVGREQILTYIDEAMGDASARKDEVTQDKTGTNRQPAVTETSPHTLIQKLTAEYVPDKSLGDVGFNAGISRAKAIVAQHQRPSEMPSQTLIELFEIEKARYPAGASPFKNLEQVYDHVIDIIRKHQPNGELIEALEALRPTALMAEWMLDKCIAVVKTHEPREISYKDAVDYMYASIGRDFGHLEPLDAAKKWTETVLSKAPDPSEISGKDSRACKECGREYHSGPALFAHELQCKPKRESASEISDDFDSDKARKDLKPAALELLKQPIIQSLLYDIDLLPEQIKTKRHWFYMLQVLSHMNTALKREIGEVK